MTARADGLTGRRYIDGRCYVDGLTVRRYVAVVHVEVTSADDPNTAAQTAADLLTAGATDPGDDIQIVSITEVAR